MADVMSQVVQYGVISVVLCMTIHNTDLFFCVNDLFDPIIIQGSYSKQENLNRLPSCPTNFPTTNLPVPAKVEFHWRTQFPSLDIPILQHFRSSIFGYLTQGNVLSHVSYAPSILFPFLLILVVLHLRLSRSNFRCTKKHSRRSR